MAGTISLSLSQQFDAQGRPLSGGLLYFFSSGTTTPQNSFQDFALTIPHPNPIVLDASGRVPAFYLADGFIKIRLADDNGVTVIAADGLLVIGPSTGTGGGTTVDPNAVLATGDIKARYGTGTLTGFVRCNGNTIGSASASTTERSNADCQALFEYLWTNNVSLVVSGGRGATANADWLANKSITLPDLRGRTIAGLDDMGAASGAAGRMTSTWFGAATTTMGNAGGNEKTALTAAQLPLHTHSGSGNTGGFSNDHSHTFGGTTSGQSADHTHTYTDASATQFPGGGGGAPNVFSPNAGTSTTSGVSNDHSHNFSGTTSGVSANHSHGFSFTTNAGDGVSGTQHSIANPSMVMTFYIKL